MGDSLILGVDIGSSNIKALLVTPTGQVVASAGAEVQELYPAAGQTEQEPLEIWERFCAAVGAVMSAPGVNPAKVVGMALDSNRSGMMLADEAMQPLTRMMTWRDLRSEKYVRAFGADHPEIDVYRITGEEGLPQHSLFKFLWCQQEIPDIWARCHHVFLSPKDYVLYRLLGKRITSRSMAQSTGLFDINKLCYSEAILQAGNISRDLLPQLLDSNERAGALGADVAAQLGMPAGVPIICGLCDATASQLGSGSVEEGLFTISIGTCGAIRTFSKVPVYAENKFSQVRVLSPFGYVPTCTVNDAGSVLKWYRNEFCGAQSMQAKEQGVDVYQIIDRRAAEIPAGSQGLLLLPYFTGASYAVKNADTFGVFAGIRNFHTHAHFSRAIMEGVAFSLRTVLDSFRADGFHVAQARMGGGGANSPLWTQIICDILNIPIQIPACAEASALGSAMIAAVGLGIHPNLETAVREMVRFTGAYQPTPANTKVYENSYRLFCRLLDTMHDYYKLHAEITADGDK